MLLTFYLANKFLLQTIYAIKNRHFVVKYFTIFVNKKIYCIAKAFYKLKSFNINAILIYINILKCNNLIYNKELCNKRKYFFSCEYIYICLRKLYIKDYYKLRHINFHKR